MTITTIQAKVVQDSVDLEESVLSHEKRIMPPIQETVQAVINIIIISLKQIKITRLQLQVQTHPQVSSRVHQQIIQIIPATQPQPTKVGRII